MEEANGLFPFREIFPISATRGDNVEPLLKALTAALPAGPALYPADQLTDRPIRELAKELIREKALIFTHEEVPHAVAVTIDEWRAGQPSNRTSPIVDRPSPINNRPCTYIRATLYVERASQKGILIGKEGALLKKIGQSARKEIERLVEGPVFLDLWIKIARNWRKDLAMLKRLGYG